MNNKLHGLFAATLSPLKPDGTLNFEQVPGIVSHLKQSGVAGIYIAGSTGEGMSLTLDERRDSAEAFIAAARGQLQTVVHVGHNSLTEAKSLAEHAWLAGADVISATSPSYYGIPNVSTLVDSMAEIASAVPEAPFYYYHIPSLTRATISIPLFLKHASEKIPNLVGVKYTAPHIHEYQASLNVGDGKFDLVWGMDEMLLSALVVGAKGAIGSTYNVAAPL